MSDHSGTPTPEPAEEGYTVKYEVHFHNCTINTVKIEQTGKPGSGDPPPGTGGGGNP